MANHSSSTPPVAVVPPPPRKKGVGRDSGVMRKPKDPVTEAMGRLLRALRTTLEVHDPAYWSIPALKMRSMDPHTHAVVSIEHLECGDRTFGDAVQTRLRRAFGVDLMPYLSGEVGLEETVQDCLDARP